MKKIFLLLSIFVSSLCYGELIPKNFKIRVINDVDSAIAILNKSFKIQYYAPRAVDINSEFFDQTTDVGKIGAHGWGWGVRTAEQHKATYYEYITKIYVRKKWIIYIENSVNKADQLIFKNKAVAEETISALLCLIKNSGNRYSQKIHADMNIH